MRSRITIEVDFNKAGEPFIQVLESYPSDDLRDKALRTFLQKAKFAEGLKIEKIGESVVGDEAGGWNKYAIRIA